MSDIYPKNGLVRIEWPNEHPGSYTPNEARFLAGWSDVVDLDTVQNAINAL